MGETDFDTALPAVKLAGNAAGCRWDEGIVATAVAAAQNDPPERAARDIAWRDATEVLEWLSLRPDDPRTRSILSRERVSEIAGQLTLERARSLRAQADAPTAFAAKWPGHPLAWLLSLPDEKEES